MGTKQLHVAGSLPAARAALNRWLHRSLEHDCQEVHSEDNGWTTVMMDLDDLPVEDWQELAGCCDFLYESHTPGFPTESYFDGCRAEIVLALGGQLVRRLLLTRDERVNQGRLSSETSSPLAVPADVSLYIHGWRWVLDVPDCE